MHIGNKIKNIFDTKHIDINQFANRLGMQRANIYKIFERESLQTDLLFKIGMALEYNFFELLMEEQNEEMGVGPEYVEVSLKVPRKELDQLI